MWQQREESCPCQNGKSDHSAHSHHLPVGTFIIFINVAMENSALNNCDSWHVRGTQGNILLINVCNVLQSIQLKVYCTFYSGDQW